MSTRKTTTLSAAVLSLALMLPAGSAFATTYHSRHYTTTHHTRHYKHHSQTRGAIVGAVAGAVVDHRHPLVGAVAGGVLGNVIQHERNRH
jgi:uncharacterized protein YcfJ